MYGGSYSRLVVGNSDGSPAALWQEASNGRSRVALELDNGREIWVDVCVQATPMEAAPAEAPAEDGEFESLGKGRFAVTVLMSC